MQLIFEPKEHKYFVDGIEYPSVTTILSNLGFCDHSKVDQEISARAREFGTVIDETLALADQNNLGGCDPLAEKYLKQWEKFKKQYLIVPFTAIIGKPLYSKLWNFAGTPDRIFLMRGMEGNILVDIKTGQEYAWHRFQTAGYKIMAEEQYSWSIKRRMSVYLTEKSFVVRDHPFKEDEYNVKSMVAIYNLKKKLKLIPEVKPDGTRH